MEQRIHRRTTALSRQILPRTIPTASLLTSPESDTEQPQNDVPMHVPTNDTIFSKTERLDLAGLLKVYGDFFPLSLGQVETFSLLERKDCVWKIDATMVVCKCCFPAWRKLQ